VNESSMLESFWKILILLHRSPLILTTDNRLTVDERHVADVSKMSVPMPNMHVHSCAIDSRAHALMAFSTRRRVSVSLVHLPAFNLQRRLRCYVDKSVKTV
jgi:hypothetical protein